MAYLAVVVVRRRDQHGVDLRQREQLAVVGDAHDAAVGALLAQRLAPRRERRLMRVSDRDDLALGNQVQVAQVLLANAARADDAEADDAWRLGERRRERLEQRERHAAAAERLRNSSATGSSITRKAALAHVDAPRPSWRTIQTAVATKRNCHHATSPPQAHALAVGMALLALTATVLAGIYPSGHFDTAKKLTTTNFDDHVKEQVDAGKTLFVRWIASEG